MEWTDRHYRFLMRGVTRHTQLYTEMVVDSTVRGWSFLAIYFGFFLFIFFYFFIFYFILFFLFKCV
jgi:hypothetical protein